MNRELRIHQLEMTSAIHQVIDNLPCEGNIKIAVNGFSYLDINDDFIHQIYPLLGYLEAMKPDYFTTENNYIGAHISIIYPEENTQLDANEANKRIEFEIVGLFCADLADTRYFAFKVNAPELIRIRQKYGLSDKMQLKGCMIESHITIATKNLREKNCTKA